MGTEDDEAVDVLLPVALTVRLQVVVRLRPALVSTNVKVMWDALRAGLAAEKMSMSLRVQGLVSLRGAAAGWCGGVVGAVCIGTKEVVVLVWCFLGSGLPRTEVARERRARSVVVPCMVAIFY